MTLVVARRQRNGVRLLADWRLTREDGQTPSYLNGTLKAWILHPTLCVAYAGNSYQAESAMRDLEVAPAGHVELRLILASLEQQQQRGCDADFIVASRSEGLGLWVVRDGIASARDEAWIGDQAAYDLYRTFLPGTPAFTASDAPPDVTEFSSMASAFGQVLRQDQITSVGEIAIGVVHDPAGFRYMGGATMYAPSQSVPSGQWTTLHFGTAASGGFGYEIIRAESVPAVGVHFHHGGLGALFFPARLPAPAIYRGVTQTQFRDSVWRDHDVRLLPDVSVG